MPKTSQKAHPFMSLVPSPAMNPLMPIWNELPWRCVWQHLFGSSGVLILLIWCPKLVVINDQMRRQLLNGWMTRLQHVVLMLWLQLLYLQISSSGVKLKNFKDASLATSHSIYHVLAALQPDSVDWSLVTEGNTGNCSQCGLDMSELFYRWGKEEQCRVRDQRGSQDWMHHFHTPRRYCWSPT